MQISYLIHLLHAQNLIRSYPLLPTKSHSCSPFRTLHIMFTWHKHPHTHIQMHTYTHPEQSLCLPCIQARQMSLKLAHIYLKEKNFISKFSYNFIPSLINWKCTNNYKCAMNITMMHWICLHYHGNNEWSIINQS